MAILQCASCNGLNIPRGTAAIFLYDPCNDKLNPSVAKRLRQRKPLSQVAQITIGEGQYWKLGKKEINYAGGGFPCLSKYLKDSSKV